MRLDDPALDSILLSILDTVGPCSASPGAGQCPSAMIEKLQHRVDVADSTGGRFSLPCDSDRPLVVALVPQGKDQPDHLTITHRPSGAAIVQGFPAIDAGLEQARKFADECGALPIDWSIAGVDALSVVVQEHLEAFHEIVRRAYLWLNIFWSSVGDDG